MNAHPRMGFGPETTDDEFAAIGRAEFARFIVEQLKCSRRAHDPVKVQQWFQGRTGIDQETRRLVLTTLFPKGTTRAVARPRHAIPQGLSVAANRA